MPPKPSTAEMGRLHEEYLAQINDGKKTAASGSGWAEQADGRNHHDLPFAYRWDGKSTLGQSITVTLPMVEKILDQAHGERPQIGLRWYGDDRLKSVLADWVAVRAADWEETLMAARSWVFLETAVGEVTPARVRDLLAREGERDGTITRLQEEVGRLRDELASAETALETAGTAIETRDRLLAERGRQVQMRIDQEAAVQRDPSRAVPGYVPCLPWTVIHAVHTVGQTLSHTALSYDKEGYQSVVDVGSVRVERSLGSSNRPRLILNDVRVPQGDLYVDGKLRVRACQADPDIEVG